MPLSRVVGLLALLVVDVSGFKQPDFVDPVATAPGPIVDVGYSLYRGYYNSTFSINVWKGIRFAAPPKRWQLPEPPESNRTSVIDAANNPPRCPQAPSAPRSSKYNFTTDVLGNEDCLFLNVFAPVNASKLPVLVWIHGGGYGQGSASQYDFSYMDQTVSNAFVSVVIQYRLGAFGFASSAELARHGHVNTGLHDMRMALQWVQQHIALFGGDPSRVTISGESAGGGSVMLMAMMNDGRDETSLFRGIIASSPYLPTQPDYDDPAVEDYWSQFVRRAGCGNRITDAIFDCLNAADSITLQRASAETSLTARFGQWAFIPVTDRKLIMHRPTQQLHGGRLNGDRVLTGNNANEGYYFVPQNITTEAEFTSFIELNFPHLSAENITGLMSLYSIPANVTYASHYDSNGLTPPYATELSGVAGGWQEAANNLYGEATFVCPAYWLADGFTPNLNPSAPLGGRAWRYQFSVPEAFHGADLAPLLENPGSAGLKEDAQFMKAFQSTWGNFIIGDSPNLSGSLLKFSSRGNITAAAAGSWLPWGTAGTFAAGRKSQYPMLNLNVTNGQPYKSDWAVVDAQSWENGRGARCALWAELGAFAEL